MDLCELILALQPRWWHLMMRILGLTHEALREWCPVTCPCEVDLDPGEGDLEDALAA